ncbi:mitochondrial ribonuclease P catalytic subunit [Nematolebias whitei]|uniref:mitochondrial ribonuclease P catalytic subunit n=1 Tax=Nematolebias whitei TaxID=451745 RepID=UPI0018995921|nr:mitochondrial ribonuclease P catalytic subunit [Nematolebias whitei]
MGSTFILKVRICLKSPQLLSSARCFCTREFKQNLSSRQMDRSNREQADGQAGFRNSNISQGMKDGSSRNTTMRKMPSFPKSVFAAGTAKRTAEKSKRRESLASVDEEEPARVPRNLQVPEGSLSPAEWKKLKESLGNSKDFETQMMLSFLNSGTELDIVKSLLTFVAVETGTLPYKLLLRYLHLCVNRARNDEVFDVYKIMRGSFPSLETGASTLFIKSFSKTAQWKEALSVLQELKKVITPSQRNYSDVITGALQHGDMTTAWALYDELIEKGLTPHQDTWEALFASTKTPNEENVMHETEHQERLQGVLLYMRDNQIYPQHNVASKIKTWFESLSGQNWTGGWTTVTLNGMCRHCGSDLESIQLSAEEYKNLKDRVMADVIQGRDVFKKTTPEELERFKVFVSKKPAFDVVVDGLNVANINKQKRMLSETLLAVVSELECQGLNVLVLGRKHMLRPSMFWKKHNMSLIQQKAHCFFTDNISEDDPFLLYATLHSGNHSRFVSLDLMRDHKACLPDRASKRLFFKWQRGHQMVVHGIISEGRRVRFLRIPSYDTIIQTTGDSWHIPYDGTEDRSSYEVPQRWLCLTKKH